MTVCSLDVLLSLFWASPFFHVCFKLLLLGPYRFLRRQVRWSRIPISLKIFQFVVMHSHSQWRRNRFFFLIPFFYDPMDICSLISGSSTFSESSLYIWKFSVHIQLKPSLKNFEHYLASMWNECNCMVVWTFFGLPFFWIGKKTDLFRSCGHCWVFQICWHSECNSIIF